MQQALAQHVANAAHSPLSTEAVEAAQTFLLDTLCIGVAGRRAAYRDELLPVVARWGVGDQVAVLGDKLRLPVGSAAFLNCFQMHALEFDCVHEDAVAHVMTTVAAATLAELNVQQALVPGERLLRALCAGVDVAANLGLAAAAPLSFFRPATTGIFGAAAALAVLRGYDEAQVRQTFGYCLAQAAGTMQAHEEGKPTLPIQIGHAARHALTAADMALTGIPAPEQSIDGTHGYLALFETAVAVGALCEPMPLGTRATQLSHKPFPSGRATHGGVEAVQLLRGQGATAENVARMTLTAPPLIHQLVIRPPTDHMNVNYARLCFPYVGAVALQRGTVTLADFSEAALRNSDTLALANRFEAVVAKVASPSAFTPQTLVATLQDDRELRVEIAHLLGSPAHPLGREAAHAKARDCLAEVYTDAPERLARLVAQIAGLADSADCRNFAEMIAGDPG